ncbi:MAG: BolA/IbaG family iron-sulfur metabolism protein [Rickettsiaceae bacterium]|nr:BolA/IbaG family iron-sulfur metabolism protein [Rickettsiaceae bacterium]
MAISQKELFTILQQNFPNAKEINVKDLTEMQNNYLVEIRDDIFSNLTLLKQHRLVKDALAEVLKEKLHAVTIKTKI